MEASTKAAPALYGVDGAIVMEAVKVDPMSFLVVCLSYDPVHVQSDETGAHVPMTDATEVPLTLLSIAPTTGGSGGGEVVTVQAEGFVGFEPYEVLFGTAPAFIDAVSLTTFGCRAPAGTALTSVDVSASSSKGASNVLVGAYSYSSASPGTEEGRISKPDSGPSLTAAEGEQPGVYQATVTFTSEGPHHIICFNGTCRVREKVFVGDIPIWDPGKVASNTYAGRKADQRAQYQQMLGVTGKVG
jgi:hypothetical protein